VLAKQRLQAVVEANMELTDTMVKAFTPFTYLLTAETDAKVFIYRSIHLSIFLSIDLSIDLSIYLSIYLSIHLSIYLSIDLSIIYLSIY